MHFFRFEKFYFISGCKWYLCKLFVKYFSELEYKVSDTGLRSSAYN